MTWYFEAPVLGDMLRVGFNSIFHYGIFVSEDEVIQFGLSPLARANQPAEEIQVCTTDLDGFLCGYKLEVARFDEEERKKNRTPEDAVAFARSKLGTRGYHILYNNCEHFAYECITGKPFCSQTANLRAMFQSLPLVDVYTCAIPCELEMTPLYPESRQAELDSVSNIRVKTEKWCAWKLLEYALERSLGVKMKQTEFEKNENGKWTSEKCFFSISHSDEAVAVAVSRKPVGVDIESHLPSQNDRFADKILNENERALYDSTADEAREHFLLEKWTAKESLFKKDGTLAGFIPKEQDTLSGGLRTLSAKVGGKSYTLSVATDTPKSLRIYENIDLLSKI